MPSRRRFLHTLGTVTVGGCLLGPVPAYADATRRLRAPSASAAASPPALYADARHGGDLNSGTLPEAPVQTLAHLRRLLTHGADHPPVALADLSGRIHETKHVRLAWTTAYERAHAGFRVLVRTDPEAPFERVAQVPSQGPSDAPQPYTFVLRDRRPGVLQCTLGVEDPGYGMRYSSVLEIEVPDPNVGDDWDARAELPWPNETPFEVSEFAPNPTAGRAKMTLWTATTQPVRATLYDAQGRRHAVLFEGTAEGGRTYTLTADARERASGVYFCHVEARAFRATRRLVVVR